MDDMLIVEHSTVAVEHAGPRRRNGRNINAHTPLGFMSGGRCNGWRWRVTRRTEKICGRCGATIGRKSRAWMRGCFPKTEYRCGSCSSDVSTPSIGG
jgi:hypothetical protein